MELGWEAAKRLIMKIELKNIKITNFKGIKNLEVYFLDQTTIEGENATFKSTVLDAVLWLLFGKNADDKKDFEIKPLDKFNNPLPKLENSVEGELFIDGQKSILKRIQREKWVKPHGESEYTFTGNETVYEINGVPKKQKEYNDFINDLVQENLFKLITSTTYFNNLHWEKRREMLIGLAGTIKDQDVVDKMSNVEQGDIILSILNEGKSMNDAKKEINAGIKRIKDELKLIPSRIDEAQRDKPEKADFDRLKKNLKTKEAELDKIEKQLQDKSEAVKSFYEDKAAKQAEIGLLNQELILLEAEHGEEYKIKTHEIEALIKQTNYEISSVGIIDISPIENEILIINNSNEGLRSVWHEVNNTKFEFDESKSICPTCKQGLPNANKIKAELEENFNLNTIKSLNSLKTEGEENNAKIRGLEHKIRAYKIENQVNFKKIEDLSKEKSKLQNKLDSLVAKPLNSQEYNDLKAQISAKETEINTMIGVDNPIELQGQKADLKAEIDQLNIKLMDADRIDAIEKRVEELSLDEKTKAQAIADLEKTEFAIQSFVKIKMEYIENKVNSMFEMVKFKMFETQINGGQKEVCETLVNGVPFNSDLNTGHKVLAGLDIIKTFSKHYDMYAPVFVDNAESVTEPFPAMDSQMVFLYAKKGVKKLVIS